MWGTEKLRWTNRVSRATKEENPCGKTSVRAKSEPTDMTVEKIIRARAGNSLAVQVRTPGFHFRRHEFDSRSGN